MKTTIHELYRISRHGLAAWLALGLFAGQPFTPCAQAQVLASNYGAGFSLVTPGTPGYDLMFGAGAAVQFTLGANNATFNVGQLQLQRVFQQADGVTISLDADNHGLPGTALETFNVSGISDNGGGSLITVDSTLHPLLKAHTSYWLAATSSGGEWSVWLQNAEGALNPTAVFNGVNWTHSAGVAPVFTVSGTIIPNPPSGNQSTVPEPG